MRSRYRLSVGLNVKPMDTTFATMDAAIEAAKAAYRNCGRPVYVTDYQERDLRAAVRGYATEKGWRWLRPCPRCPGGVDPKTGKTCTRCGGTGRVEDVTNG